MLIDPNSGLKEIIDFKSPVETIDIVHVYEDHMNARKVLALGKSGKFSGVTLNQGWANLVKNSLSEVSCRMVLCSDKKHRILIETPSEA